MAGYSKLLVMFNPKDERELLSPPGDTILETLEHINMSQVELAARLGITLERLSEIISAKKPITLRIAVGLHEALGIDVQFWLNREALYRAKLKKIQAAENEND